MTSYRLIVEEKQAPMRIDRWLAEQLPNYSRSKIQRWIQDELVTVGGELVHQGFRVEPHQEVVVEVPSPQKDNISPEIPIDVIFEDDEILVVNKQTGLVIHPGVENQVGTLVQALEAQGYDLFEADEPERPGVVHRLDKETSGVMILAKSASAYYDLVEQFSERTNEKYYLAVVQGEIDSELGRIEASIGRDVKHPAKMAVSKQRGKEAITEFRVLNSRDNRTLLLIKLLTGRTHQIRVHLEAIGHPVVGDALYGSSARAENNAERMMLHAWKLVIDHPESGERLSFIAAPPPEVDLYLEGVSLDEASGVFDSLSEDNPAQQ